MHILVIGGAGYIGSHMVKMLYKKGYQVTSFDNLSTGYKNAIQYGDFIYGDLANLVDLKKLFKNNQFDAVMHLASFIQAGESVHHPTKYYRNNFIYTINLLDAMVSAKVKYFIFSSSAAIYGEPQYIPIDENHPKNPMNPYGTSKWMVEQVLADYDRAYGLKSVSLRYFNAAGADPEGELGERHNPETHLIPLILQTAHGKREAIKVFGIDYPTKDGSCIRDYVHIMDLCYAHLLSLKRLMTTMTSNCYNLGNTRGFSVLEVIQTCQKITQKNFQVIYTEKRLGDPSILVANAEKAHQELDWQPQYSLEEIIQHAWQWELKN